LAAQRRLLSITGVAAFDALAKDSPQALQAFLDEVRQNGWIVKSTDKLPSERVAYFLPRKRRFYYNPERMTILDMQHEAKHLELFRQRGNWRCGPGGAQVFSDEIEAYKFEYEFGKRNGFSDEYMQYLERQIKYYENLLAPTPAPEMRPPIMPDPYFKRLGPV
jgi:hypothetical protein